MERFVNREHFICTCDSVEHQLVITYFEDDNFEVYCSFHLAPLPFWRRLWHGIKYIFGYRCRYGDFEEFIFHKSDADKLQKIIDILKK